MKKSALQIARAAYQPKLPQGLRGNVTIKEGAPTQSVADQEEIKKLFPNTYGMPLVEFVPSTEKREYAPMNMGVILSGGQAPGGHNVICGLFDELKKQNPANRLYGFILGPGGLVDHKYMELTADIIDEYRNTGGFDMIGSGRTKLETKEQFESGLEIIRELGIKALVIIGGDDSNTNACVLAEYYAAQNYGVQVIGCPKTIDGDLKNDQIETSFGFDTACKTYAEVIGNIQRDANSARKYWHFIKLMGRSASHIALECALQCQPNVCIISEEVEAKNQTLDDIVTYIAGVVAQRAADGNNFGTVLIPEGLIEFIPAMKKLIAELNDLLATPEAAKVSADEQRAWVIGKLSKENAAISGAMYGCQAEIGSAASFASAALAYLDGLSVYQIEYAAEVAMEHFLGLTCDPVDGYVQIPCIERNAMAAIHSYAAYLFSKDIALYRHNLVSFDNVVRAMKETGQELPPDLKETSLGGLAKIIGNC